MADSNNSKNTPVDPALPEKKRGRRRLIGAAAFLVGAGVLLSLLFDHEPKPPTPELALKIPPKEKLAEPNPAAPTAKPSQPAAAPSVTPSPEPPAPKVVQTPEPGKTETAKVESPKPAAAKVDSTKAKPKKPEAADDDPIAKIATGKGLTAGQGGFVVQIGAFSSTEKLEAAIATAKEAGFKVITEKVKTVNGDRTRVRVGPFADKDAANNAREKLKDRGLEPAVIAL
jgi:DedD protein